ncbi:MAG: hypothetical protein CMF55_06460 [Legionellales bacterium]|nr:hypothetical protein [Legionellales bacterium]
MSRNNSNTRILFIASICLVIGLSHSYGYEDDVDYEWDYDINERLQSNHSDRNYDNGYDLPEDLQGFSGGCLAYYQNTGFFYEHGNVYARTYFRGPNAHYPDCKKLDFKYFKGHD